jgi:hypothetical protein
MTPVQELTDGFLDAVDPVRPVDLVEARAAPLPVQVIAELFGVPVADFPSSAPIPGPLVTGTMAGRDAYVTAAVQMLELLWTSSRAASPGPATTWLVWASERNHGLISTASTIRQSAARAAAATIWIGGAVAFHPAVTQGLVHRAAPAAVLTVRNLCTASSRTSCTSHRHRWSAARIVSRDMRSGRAATPAMVSLQDRDG